MANTESQKLQRYFKRGEPIRYKKGEVIIRGGDEEDSLYLVSDGYIQVYEIAESGQHYVHFIYKQSEIFPLLWLTDTPAQQLYYEAMTDVTVYKIATDSFLKFIDGNLGVRMEIWQRLNKKFNLFYNRVRNLQLQSAQERLVFRLVELAERFGKPSELGIVISLPVTHQDIANSISVSRETVSREFEKLKRAKLISYEDNPRRLVIRDLKKLKSKLGSQAAVL